MFSTNAVLLLVIVAVAECSTLVRSARAVTGQEDCAAQRDAGTTCNQAQQSRMFYFDKLRGVCQPFTYNGCGGTMNRFATAADCRDYCINGEGAQKLQRQMDAPQNPLAGACSVEADLSHLEAQTCTSNTACQTGFECSSGYCCPTADYLCNLAYDAGKFSVGGGKSDRYFYATEFGVCMRFSYYGTLGNANNFLDYFSCKRTCGGN